MMDTSRFELATDETFDEGPYLMANPDVARHVAAGGDAWDHFDRHGRKEGRLQLTPQAAGLPAARSARKYQRFAPLLNPNEGAGGSFRYLAEERSFPIFYGATAHSISDYEAESANPGFADFVDTVRANPEQLYMDVGCGRRGKRYDNCLYLDVYSSPSADIVMEPACQYPIASNSLDGIGCFAVLEHVTEPWTVASEIQRMLKPGGLIFIDYPFLVPVHGYPSHYYNSTREGLARLFGAGFEHLRLDTRDNQTPDHSVHWQLNGLRQSLSDPALFETFGKLTVDDLCNTQPGTGIWKALVAALPGSARAGFAAGNTLVARKL
jgi:SAM-dependent methyltransferase